jgi:hypothetical protein
LGKILKIENHSYSIIYINDNEKYNVYRRFPDVKWEIFRRGQWRLADDSIGLEKLFKEQKKIINKSK